MGRLASSQRPLGPGRACPWGERGQRGGIDHGGAAKESTANKKKVPRRVIGMSTQYLTGEAEICAKYERIKLRKV